MIPSVKMDAKDGILIATLNRPDKLNALNKAVFDELQKLISMVESDRAIRGVVLTGAGDKAFCVGADLKERQGMNEKDVLARFEMVKALYTRMEGLRVPLVGALQGSALGGGLELAMVCDLRLAANHVLMGFPEVKLGIIPGNGGTQRLGPLVGLGRALELVLTARRLTAEEALAWGLINRCHAKEDLLQEAIHCAASLAEGGPLALAQAKRALRQGMYLPRPQGYDFETECYKVCLYSQDRLEGLKAFQEKRMPQFQGK